MSRGISCAGYWLSASVLTMMSAPSRSARVEAGHEAGGQPLAAA